MKYELYGLGNPLMDLLVEVDEAEFSRFNLKKGQFHLVSKEDFMRIKGDLLGKEVTFSPGGSTSNVISIFTMLGGKGYFCGKVGNDGVADYYEKEMNDLGIKTKLIRGKELTGTAITFITPDSERTFAVYLGDALNMNKGDVDLEALRESKALFVGGYELEDPNLREVTLYAMNFAKKHNIMICIDLADPGIIEREKKLLRHIVDEYADIVFSNEAEATALTGSVSAEDALDYMAKLCQVVVVKLGNRGSVIKEGERTVRIKGIKVDAIDTTGAGDIYAGAFIYAYLKGHDLEVAGNLGSFLAASVVTQIGARLQELPDVSHIMNVKN